MKEILGAAEVRLGHDAFAVIRETIRDMSKVAIGRVVLTSREHIIALEPLDKGLVGTLLRYPYEVRSEHEYFDEILGTSKSPRISVTGRIIVSGVCERGELFDPLLVRSEEGEGDK